MPSKDALGASTAILNSPIAAAGLEPAVPRPEAWSAWALRGPLAAGLAALVLLQLLCWVPHYLSWPLFADHDVFATAARAWDAGLRPYRDLRGDNFPGTLYLFWILGKAFGWGSAAPLYAADATLLGLFGGLLLAWSRRRFASLLPGLAGYTMILGYYLSLDYTQTAQRDWHAPLLLAAGLLTVQAAPGRLGRLASVALAALALSVRPQVALFLPAMVLAFDEGARRPGMTWASTRYTILTWGLILGALLVLMFIPLAAAGVGGDFVRGIRLALPGGSYSRFHLGSFRAELMRELAPLRLWGVSLVILLLAGRAEPALRRLTLTWLVALAGALLYKPLSPVSHAYLDHPLRLIEAIQVAVLVALALEAPAVVPSLRLALIMLALGLGATARPRFCNLVRSLEALTTARCGDEPSAAPLGYARNLDVRNSAPYHWTDYRATLAYLRRATSPETRVANALKEHPAVTGSTARLPVFPAESVAWLRLVRPQDEPEFARALESTPDSVVVWSPAEADSPRAPRLITLVSIIRRLYEPEARFGAIEVWRRKRM